MHENDSLESQYVKSPPAHRMHGRGGSSPAPGPGRDAVSDPSLGVHLIEASNAMVSSGWATFSPDTEAMTAINAMQTPTKIVRRCRGS